MGGWFQHPGAFGLPDGTVRAILTFTVILPYIFMVCVVKWSPPELATMASMAFAWYFATRATETQQEDTAVRKRRALQLEEEEPPADPAAPKV